MSFDKNRLKALISLIDEPDNEMWVNIRNSIVDYGDAILDFLKNEYENTLTNPSKSRLKELVYETNLNRVEKKLISWIANDNKELIDGCMIIEEALNPWIDIDKVWKQFQKIRFDIWLDLNQSLTALEKINVLNNIFFIDFKFNKDEKFCISTLLSEILNNKCASELGSALIYYTLAKANDLPVRILPVKNTFFISYMNTNNEVPFIAAEEPLFFIDPYSGKSIGLPNMRVLIDCINPTKQALINFMIDEKQILEIQLTTLSTNYKAYGKTINHLICNRLLKILK